MLRDRERAGGRATSGRSRYICLRAGSHARPSTSASASAKRIRPTSRLCRVQPSTANLHRAQNGKSRRLLRPRPPRHALAPSTGAPPLCPMQTRRSADFPQLKEGWRGGRDSKPGVSATENNEKQRDSGAGQEPASTEEDETRRAKPEQRPPADAVESALAAGISEATRAERWDVVAQLARELEARRLALATNVVALAPRQGVSAGERR